MIYLQLLLTFLKIGVVSFGGGYAMIPLITDEVVLHNWLTQEEVMNFIAVAESTPGPIAINMATFIGASQAGFLGSLLATIGIVLPSFVIILLIATIIKNLMHFAGVKAFLAGLRPVICGLIVSTGLLMVLSVVVGLEKIGQPINIDYKSLIIFGVVAITHIVYKKIKKSSISPILLIILSAVLGVLLFGVLG